MSVHVLAARMLRITTVQSQPGSQSNDGRLRSTISKKVRASRQPDPPARRWNSAVCCRGGPTAVAASTLPQSNSGPGTCGPSPAAPAVPVGDGPPAALPAAAAPAVLLDADPATASAPAAAPAAGAAAVSASKIATRATCDLESSI
jgi:hypothetical protein